MIALFLLACKPEVEPEVPDAGDARDGRDNSTDSSEGHETGSEDTDRDDTGPDIGPDDCEVKVVSTVPANGSADAYYRAPIEFHLNQRYPDAMIVSDFPGELTVLEGGEIWMLTPDPPLLPNTPHTVSIETCAGESDLHFTTSALGSTLLEPLDLVSEPYLVEFDEARFVKPAGVGAILQQYLNSGLYLVPTAIDARSIVMFGASTLPETDQQAYCSPTIDLPEGSFDEVGYFDVGGGSTTTLTVSGISLELSNFTVQGTFSPDGSYFGGGRIIATVDTRPLDILVDEEAKEGYICDLAAGLGIACLPCPDGGEYCLDLEIDQLYGTAKAAPIVEIEGTNCLGCLDGVPPDVSETCEIDPDADESSATCAVVATGTTVAWAGILALLGRRRKSQL